MGKDWKKELLDTCIILKENGIDLKSIQISLSKDGKRVGTKLKDIHQNGIDIEKIINENNLNEDMPIGEKIRYFKSIYNGNINVKISEEYRKLAEEIGLVEKIPEERQKPIFKGKKISQFHIDIVRELLEDIKIGKINLRETIQIINERAIKENKKTIKDSRTVKRILEIILKDNPEELKKILDNLKNNTGKRYPRKVITGVTTNKDIKDLAHWEVDEIIKKTIIEKYLPLFLSKEITLKIIASELKTSHSLIDRVIKDYFKETGDFEGLRKYEEVKSYNRGTSLEAGKKAKEERKKIAEYEVVGISEFGILKPEEQDKQILMKIRQRKLIEEKRSDGRTRVSSERFVLEKIEYAKNYFRSKNNEEEKYFSEFDIRNILFRYPTIINRVSENLDNKLQNLLSYEEIDEKTAYGIIKTFPAIMGYDVKRTKEQIDLLKKENMMDVIINKPLTLMMSPGLMYSLIEFAKERHKTSDLSEIKRSNIFMGNTSIKRIYGVTHQELKEKYPYQGEKEADISYEITGKDLGKVATKDLNPEAIKEAANVLTKSKEESNKGDQEKND